MAEHGSSPDDVEGNHRTDQDIPMSTECSEESNNHATSGVLPLRSIVGEGSYGVVLGTIKVLVRRVNGGDRKSFEFSSGAMIQNLVEKIELEFHEKEGKEITVYEPAAIEGSISKPKDWTALLDEYNNKELVFHVKGRALPADTIAELKSYVCGQNIACLGAPGHGKSSFINTIFKSLGKKSCAQTYRGNVSGTVAFTPYPVDIDGVEFTLWDVPGAAVKAVQEDQLKHTIENILRGKQQPNRDIGSGAQWTETYGQQIHAILAIQDGQSETDKMHAVFRDVSSSLGRAIPLFMVMTHIDLMTQKAIEDQQELLSGNVGIDRSNIYTIANYDHSGKRFNSDEDPQRDLYVCNVLMQVLSASKVYKEKATHESSWCVVA